MAKKSQVRISHRHTHFFIHAVALIRLADAAVASTLIGENNREKGGHSSVIKAMETQGLNTVSEPLSVSLAQTRVTNDSGADRGGPASSSGGCCVVS